MNEFIEVTFRRGNKRLRVKRQVPGGIEFEEADPIERTVAGIRNVVLFLLKPDVFVSKIVGMIAMVVLSTAAFNESSKTLLLR